MMRVARESDFTRVGGMLRDELITAIDALGWEGEDKPRAEKIKRALERATPHRGSYLIDTFGWAGRTSTSSSRSSSASRKTWTTPPRRAASASATRRLADRSARYGSSCEDL